MNDTHPPTEPTTAAQFELTCRRQTILGEIARLEKQLRESRSIVTLAEGNLDDLVRIEVASPAGFAGIVDLVHNAVAHEWIARRLPGSLQHRRQALVKLDAQITAFEREHSL